MRRRKFISAVIGLVGTGFVFGRTANADDIEQYIELEIDARRDPYAAAHEYRKKVAKVVEKSKAKVIRIRCVFYVDGRKGLDLSTIRIRGYRLRRLDIRHTIYVTRGPLKRVLRTNLVELESRDRTRRLTQSTFIR